MLDDALFNFVVGHIPDCPRRGRLLALIKDGEVGARREPRENNKLQEKAMVCIVRARGVQEVRNQ